MVMTRDQNAVRSHNMKTDHGSFEKVEEFKFMQKQERKKLKAD
jgi:hypothetical protein